MEPLPPSTIFRFPVWPKAHFFSLFNRPSLISVFSKAHWTFIPFAPYFKVPASTVLGLK